MTQTKTQKALILVDLQNDFCPGGNLAIPEGDAVIAVANHLQNFFDVVVASKDWHPAAHVSFASAHPGKQPGELVRLKDHLVQELWPDHCIQNSPGAEFHPQLDTQKIHKIAYKGTDQNIDSYSAFFDNRHLRSTGLGEYLREQGIQELYLMGLATDYCVAYSCLDALKLGFKVHVIEKGCRGVELSPGNIARALKEMRAAGASILKNYANL